MPAPVVNSATQNATSGVSGSYQMTASNTPMSWSVISGAPLGVSMDPMGLVSWTSGVANGNYSITIRAFNVYGFGDGTLSLNVGAATTTTTAATTTTTVPTTTTTIYLSKKIKLLGSGKMGSHCIGGGGVG